MKIILAAGAAAILALSAAPTFAAKLSPDANGDGRISLQELQQRRVAKMMRWDRDRDGRVSRVEFQAFMQRKIQHHGAPRGHRDPFARADLNRDGFITPDEVNQMVARNFARRDPNHTGYISTASMQHGAATQR